MRLPPLPGLAKPKLVSGDQIAADALKYRGAGYVFGGPANHPGNWDCSSFVSWVLGHDLHMALPGGKYGAPGFPPNAHGPVVESYASWKGAITVHAPGARGDLVLFVGAGANGHMGIVLGPDQMVSALDSASGTLVTPITGYGPPGAPIVYRRVLAAAAGTAIGTATGMAAGQQAPGLPAAAFALLLVAGMAGAVLVVAAALGTGVALAGTWAMTRSRNA